MAYTHDLVKASELTAWYNKLNTARTRSIVGLTALAVPSV